MKKEQILFICAHSDDEIIGAGGTILKYLKENKEISVYFMTFGEKANPIIKEEVMVKDRIKETQKIHKKLGVKHTEFFGLKDGKLKTEIPKHKIKDKLKKIIKSTKPSKIFTLTATDPHPDHRATHKAVIQALDETKHKCDLYTFRIWNVIETFPNLPKMYVDITKFYKEKLKLLQIYKSQQILDIWPLMPSIIINARLNGIRSGNKYAEVFYKIK